MQNGAASTRAFGAHAALAARTPAEQRREGGSEHARGSTELTHARGARRATTTGTDVLARSVWHE